MLFGREDCRECEFRVALLNYGMRVCESSSPANQRLSNPGQTRSAKSGGRPTNSTIDPPIQSNPLQFAV